MSGFISLQVMTGELYTPARPSKACCVQRVCLRQEGNIYDRNGKLLVKSIPAPAVAVDPRIVSGNEDVINELCEKLDLDRNELLKK